MNVKHRGVKWEHRNYVSVNGMPMVFSCSPLEQDAAIVISAVFLQSIDPQIVIERTEPLFNIIKPEFQYPAGSVRKLS